MLTYANGKCWQMQTTHVGGYWCTVEPFITRIVNTAEGEFSVEDVEGFLHKGVMQLFVIEDAEGVKLVALSEIVQYPRFKVVRLIGVAGEHPLVFGKFWKGLELWAKENGAEFIESFATEKAESLCKRMGMKEVYTVLRKQLMVKE